jgi:hypothetical protein
VLVWFILPNTGYYDCHILHGFYGLFDRPVWLLSGLFCSLRDIESVVVGMGGDFLGPFDHLRGFLNPQLPRLYTYWFCPVR